MRARVVSWPVSWARASDMGQGWCHGPGLVTWPRAGVMGSKSRLKDKLGLVS